MKKLLAFLLVAAMTVASAVSVNAATGLTAKEQEILTALKAGVETKGGTVKLPAEYVNQAESFLLSNDTTDAEGDEILGYISSTKELLEPLRIKSLSDIPSSAKAQVIELASDAADVVGAVLTVSGTTITITQDSKTIFEANVSTNTPVKQTDANMLPAVLVSVLLLGGVVFAVAGSRKYSAKRLSLAE